MDIDLPKYHNLKNCSDLRETGNYLRTWEISVPAVDSLEWSIVLSHLTSANLGKEEEFRNRLEDLTGKHEDMPQIRDCISRFNPFLNRYSCFYNKSMQEVVRAFKEKLEGAGTQYSGNQNFKLEESSKFLKSYIFLIATNETGDSEIIENFPKSHQTGDSSVRITLYYYCDTDSQDCKYNFGLKKERGNELKKAALNKTLKTANVLKKRRKALLGLDKEGESFVTSVLKSEYRSSIPYFYKSPYLACKLVEAGYEIDPKETGSDGYSAFYHALVTGDETLVYILHNYAANACHKTDKTFRNPDEFILNNLIKLGKILESDRKMSDDFRALNENANTVRHSASQLIRFNDFLIEMCKNILEKQKECGDISLGSVSETIARKNVILTLLETYDSFFFFNEDQVSTDYVSILNDYCKYNTYYRNLDYSATLFFFDNIFSLKERLQLNNKEYSELESSFFLSVLSSKYFSCEFLKSTFPSHKNSVYSKSFNEYRGSSQKAKDLKIIPLIERLQLKEEIRIFKQTLLEVTINNNIVSRLPEDEIPKILASVPEVKDELEIQRLMHYLETAIMKQNIDGPKRVLAVERALQVLGECLIDGRRNPRSLCFFLSACLPEETFRMLKKTRNILSHLITFGFAPKFKAEKNSFLFHSIQKDINTIYEVLKSVFDIQQLRLAEFLFRRGLQEIEKRTSSEVATPEHLEIVSRLRKEYNILRKIKSKPCYNNEIFKNLNFLTNIHNITEEKINTISSESPTEDIENILWPLRYLLTLIAKDCQDLNFRDVQGIIRHSYEFRSWDKSKITEKIREFWKSYEIIISELREKVENQKTENPPKNLHEAESVASNIDKFKTMLKGSKCLSQADQEEIRSKIPQTVYDSINLRNEIQKVWESGGNLTYEQIKKFPSLFLSKKNLKDLKKTYEHAIDKALEIVKTASDPVEELNAILDGSNPPAGKDAVNQLCDRLKFSDDVREKLLEFDSGQKPNTQENGLYSILNRIKLLREILIEENLNICELWDKAKGIKTQQFAKHKIVQRYVRDPEVRASVETLLFDCMILLGNEFDMEHLWVKASSLFSGINLRNVLGHGNPTLETVGKLLDPDDLPSVLIGEMLRLIKDEVSIKVMYGLCLKTNSDFDMFHKIMNDEDDMEHSEMRREILKCERWKIYSKLIPMAIKRKRLLSNISHSSRRDCEE